MLGGAEPFQLRHKIFLTGADLAMGRIGRLGLAGNMGVEESQDRPFRRLEPAGQRHGFSNHAADLLIGRGGSQRTAADGAEPVDLVHDDKAGRLGRGIESAERYGKRLLNDIQVGVENNCVWHVRIPVDCRIPSQ